METPQPHVIIDFSHGSTLFCSLLDRGHGRAPQTVKVEQITEMGDHELKTYIAQLRAELGIADEDGVDADKPKRLH